MQITTDELKELYQKRQPDGFWFSEETMRCFGTKIIITEQRGSFVYFVTSESPPISTRYDSVEGFLENFRSFYTVRIMDPDGEIDNIGPFCELDRDEAMYLFEAAINACVGMLNDAKEWYEETYEPGEG